MVVKVVTDSSSDIPPEVAQELGITVVPMYIRFGDKVYRDGIDIDVEEFYHKIASGSDLPKTSVPPPGDFIQAYDQLSTETDEIVSIHISATYSGTCNVARLGRDYVKGKCQIEVIDSKSASMGLGLVTIAAARAAAAGENLQQITEMVHRIIPHTHLFTMVTSMKYVLGGKRLSLSRMRILLGKMAAMLNCKLLGEIYEGKIRPVGIFRTQTGAFRGLERQLAGFRHIDEMSILYSTTPDGAHEFTEAIDPIFPRERLYIARFGCITGIQAGPGAIGAALIERGD